MYYDNCDFIKVLYHFDGPVIFDYVCLEKVQVLKEVNSFEAGSK